MSISGGNRDKTYGVNRKGKESEIASLAACFCVALEANELLVFHTFLLEGFDDLDSLRVKTPTAATEVYRFNYLGE